jgi:hypothetical protein
MSDYAAASSLRLEVIVTRQIITHTVGCVLYARRNARRFRMPQPRLVKYQGRFSKYRRHVSLIGGAAAAVIPVTIGINQVYELYISPLIKPNLSGQWCVTDVVRNSQHSAYVGIELKFDFLLVQDKDQITGTGRKVLVSGIAPPPEESSAIAIKQGLVHNKEIILSFIEGNDARKDRQYLVGTFVWSIVDANTLVGKFDTAAAGSNGDSTARRGGC